MLTLEKLLRKYEMPSDGASGDGPGSGGGNNNGGNRGGANDGKKSSTYSGPKGTPTGGLNKAARDAHKNAGKDTRGDKPKTKTGPPIGTNPAAMTPQGKVDAANAARKNNPKPKTGINIDLKSKNPPVTAGIDEPGANNAGSHSPTIDAAPAVDIDSYNFNNTKDEEQTLLQKVGQGFRDLAISLGAEPGIEGYDKDGHYGYGYNSPYGQQLQAGVKGIRAKGDLSLDQQQKMADDKNKYGTNNTAGIDEDFVGPPAPGFFDIDTDGWFGKLAKGITSFVFGKFGATLGKAFGPYGALAGLILGKVIGGKFHDYFVNRDPSGKGSNIDYQARLNDMGPGGANDGNGGDGGTNIIPKDKILVIEDPKPNGDGNGGDADGDGEPIIVVKDLSTILDELEKNYENERDEVKRQARQDRVLNRVVASRQPLPTYNRNLVY